MSQQPPNFAELAQAWLVRAQGHSRAPHEASLAEELERVFKAGWDARKLVDFEAATKQDPKTHPAYGTAMKAVVQWATENAERESVFLHPRPAHYVFWEPLLDFIAEDASSAGVTKELVGEWVDDVQDEPKA